MVRERVRKRIEEAFAWIKAIAGQSRSQLRGLARGALVVHARSRHLQPGTAAEAAGDRGSLAVTVPMDCLLVGRWRIIEADLSDRAHLDVVEPAMMTIGAHGAGQITFGAMQGGLELEYSRSTVVFTWAGFEEMDEVGGSGSAEFQDGGSFEIAFAYQRRAGLVRALIRPSGQARPRSEVRPQDVVVFLRELDQSRCGPPRLGRPGGAGRQRSSGLIDQPVDLGPQAGRGRIVGTRDRARVATLQKLDGRWLRQTMPPT